MLDIFFRRPSRADVWVQFKFERLSEFCFNYGCLGHVLLNCIVSITKRQAPDMFGPKMRVDSMSYRSFFAPKSLFGSTVGLSSSPSLGSSPLVDRVGRGWPVIDSLPNLSVATPLVAKHDEHTRRHFSRLIRPYPWDPSSKIRWLCRLCR